MENKTPGLTKLIIIFESLLLGAALLTFYFLKGPLRLPENLSWIWLALIVFSVASFLFFLVVFIIALIKKSLRTEHWTPFLFVSCIAFMVIALLMYTAPAVMQPQFVDYTGTEVVYAEEGTGETKPAQEEQEESQKLKTYEVGDTIEVGDLVIQVNSIRTAEKSEWEMLEEGEEEYILLFIDISIENTGNREAYLDIYMNFRLVDKNGRNYEFAWTEAAKGRIEGNLGAGRKIAGELSYGIPSDVKDFELEISDPNPGMFGTEMVIVNIALEE